MPFKKSEDKRRYQREYWMNVVRTNSKGTPSDSGEAGELLVGADLLARGLSVTKPLNRNGADDLHVKASEKWWTVQVKLGGRNQVTGTLLKPSRSRSPITSDVLAVVYLPTKEIRYVSTGNSDLPEELR